MLTPVWSSATPVVVSLPSTYPIFSGLSTPPRAMAPAWAFLLPAVSWKSIMAASKSAASWELEASSRYCCHFTCPPLRPPLPSAGYRSDLERGVRLFQPRRSSRLSPTFKPCRTALMIGGRFQQLGSGRHEGRQITIMCHNNFAQFLETGMEKFRALRQGFVPLSQTIQAFVDIHGLTPLATDFTLAELDSHAFRSTRLDESPKPFRHPDAASEAIPLHS